MIKLNYKDGQLLRALFWSGHHKKMIRNKPATYKEFTQTILSDISIREDRSVSESYIHAFLRKLTENEGLVFNKFVDRTSYFLVNRDIVFEWLKNDDMFKRDLEIVEEMNLVFRR